MSKLSGTGIRPRRRSQHPAPQPSFPLSCHRVVRQRSVGCGTQLAQRCYSTRMEVSSTYPRPSTSPLSRPLSLFPSLSFPLNSVSLMPFLCLKRSSKEGAYSKELKLFSVLNTELQWQLGWGQLRLEGLGGLVAPWRRLHVVSVTTCGWRLVPAIILGPCHGKGRV